ncbi:MAG TPA: ATP-binding cassette domain-containing protein [Actinomycetota bacterium]|jgi:ABC-2 type transport system ATP-binding protein|nr:ATP-binding cassette domain-containing protein [Actinomycetota bacterium]
MAGSQWAVLAEGLSKRFGGTRALDGLDLAVPAGTVCGVLGPNGAGKTTAVRILATLLRHDAGRAEVAGFDVARHSDEVRYRIGLLGQSPALDEILSGRQNLAMFGRLFHLPKSEARRRADELLEQFGLADARNKPVRDYSGGMQRRLDLAASMILSPQVLFLDEPTTGLDPRGRNEVWSAISTMVDTGTTVVLTTQYMDEADRLADQIAVIDMGRVIASGSPSELKSTTGGERIDAIVRDENELDAAAVVVAGVTGTNAEITRELRRVSASVRDRVAVLTEVVRALGEADIVVEDVALRRPTLDEVFLQLTGHHAKEGVAA